jgi:hypothetical protein
MRDFDRNFRRTERTIKGGMIGIVILRIVIGALLIFGAITLIHRINDNDKPFLEQAGEEVRGWKDAFDKGYKVEVASDTLINDTIK